MTSRTGTCAAVVRAEAWFPEALFGL